MPKPREIYRYMGTRLTRNFTYLLVIDDTPREVVALPCDKDGDTFGQEKLVYIPRHTFITMYDKVGEKK